MTFAQQIEESAGDEHIIACVIGNFGGSTIFGDGSGSRGIPAAMRNVVLPWKTARPLLDYNYDPGYGSEDCHPIFAWTASWVILCGCYDGSTWVTAVPRMPQDCCPFFVGGG